MARPWTIADIPDQAGKLVLITGANSGIGFETTKALAKKGAHVVMAVRNQEKGQQAVQAILREQADASVEMMPLNLASLQSIRAFAEAFSDRYEALPLLVNNAGVMAVPYGKTEDGFEMQFGTNHLGHFALTGLLLPKLLASPQARVVVVSSMAHTRGHVDFDNLDGSLGYRRWRFYAQSKLANLLFAYELQRRLIGVGKDTRVIACHPGFAATNLTGTGLGLSKSWWGRGFANIANLFAQSAAMGALPTLYAATVDNLQGGEYIGPVGGGKGPGSMGTMRGYPGVVISKPTSHDLAVARRLWSTSEQLTDVVYEALRTIV